MKHFLILIMALLFHRGALAETFNMNWYVDNNTYAQTTCESGGDIILPGTPTKHGYDFTGWVSYTPIEYLESTGIQYIDTGVVFNTGSLKFQALFYVKQIVGERNFIGTIRGDGNSNGFCCGTDSGIIFLYARPVNVNMSNIQTGIWYDIIGEFDNNTMSLYINGSRINYGTRDSYYCSENITLFMGGPGYRCLDTSARLGNVKIWHNNIIVRDFIPVLDKNGTPCMYDRVTEQFFYNQGTGQFIAGPSLLN